MQYSEEFINEVLATFPDNAFESPIDQRVEKLTEIYKKFKRQMKIDELYSQSESKNLINKKKTNLSFKFVFFITLFS